MSVLTAVEDQCVCWAYRGWGCRASGHAEWRPERPSSAAASLRDEKLIGVPPELTANTERKRGRINRGLLWEERRMLLPPESIQRSRFSSRRHRGERESCECVLQCECEDMKHSHNRWLNGPLHKHHYSTFSAFSFFPVTYHALLDVHIKNG